MNPLDLQNLFPGGQSTIPGLESRADLFKALSANTTSTDVATLTGGGALGKQSLDAAMKVTVQENDHIVLFKDLQQSLATNIVDEFVRQNSVGGFLGGTSNTQLGTVRTASGEYSREYGVVKFLTQIRQVGFFLEQTDNIASPMAIEEKAGAIALLSDAEYQLMHGNASAIPTQFDGIIAALDKEIAAGKLSSDHIINMDGKPLDTPDPFIKLQAEIKRYGSWGKLSHAYLTNGVQSDLNMGLDPAYRWTSDSSNTPMIGGHVDSIRLSGAMGGRLRLQEDTFLADNNFVMAKPFQLTYATVATANAGLNPASVTVDASASDAASAFSTARAGNYYWAVASISGSGSGYSQIVKSSQTAVAAGKKAVLTITRSSATTETGYAVYRSRQGGTNADADFRLVKIIPASGSSTTTFTDLNADIPGTVTVPCLNLDPASDAIGWRQFQPMTKIQLPFGVDLSMQYSWFQLLAGYLRLTKPKHHGYIKNILASNSTWLPHG
jgi:hypothetical protein